MKYFEAVATIEYGYFLIKKMFDEIQNRNPIVIAVDKATKYEDKLYNDMIPVLEDIIEAKKSINEDYSKDEEMIKKIREVLR